MIWNLITIRSTWGCETIDERRENLRINVVDTATSIK